MSDTERAAIAYLRSPQAIREQCDRLLTLACDRQLAHFRCDLTQLQPTADYVLDVIRESYPDLNVPFHSRWRHFEVDRVSRLALLAEPLKGLDAVEQARIKFDLAVTSVLLDAGAGATWRYREADTGLTFQRSEGLAIASVHLFVAGGFSSDPTRPLQADAAGLSGLAESELAAGFQVSADNPLVGLEGRVTLLQRLGKALYQWPDLFGEEIPRPGHLVDYLLDLAEGDRLSAVTVLQAVLNGMSDIWPGRVAIADLNLGDVWPHSALPNDSIGGGLVPFHKLSQWLTYSLLEPLQELGLEITDLDQLTGLAEYRNGGLCLDLGLLQPNDPAILTTPHPPGSEVIVEWRSLTVSLLDRIAQSIRHSLGMDATQLPLVKILQGGTWTAGRRIAAELRPGGPPPLQILSDGTVF
ncbi:MAG TPA: URC4/urg3 family protein [Chroococcidiopsis sp.]